ncbi:EF-hand [Coprinellus micaceus]|uniref:EF-hand n=1 Tax=Coprinellus micaceus TaxID=71717 RepID=A0A4Y7TUQ5_COPMI|nr:EF-hand [Coprinellus micaceus]
MTIFDVDRSGTIGFNEFAGLWKYIKDWQNVFRHFDRDRSGSIEGNELREALGQFGYNLSPQLLELLQKKYDATDKKANQAALSESLFGKLDSDRDRWIQMINYDQFMHTALSLP